MSFTAAAFQLSNTQLAQLPAEVIGQATSAFWRRHTGKLGFGQLARFTTTGQQRFTTAFQWWDGVNAAAVHTLPPGLQASAPVCFAAFAFDPRSAAQSVLVVPVFVLDHSDDDHWLHFNYDAAVPAPTSDEIFDQFLRHLTAEPQVAQHTDVVTESAHMSQTAFKQAVADSVDMLARGELEKVVLARDELLHSARGFHVPATMRALAHDNPSAWTYRVDGLIGSTPELLIARHQRAATARVLAGTVDRNVATTQQLVEDQLSHNSKQLFEHQAAVDSLVETLQPFATELDVSAKPFVLTLPNVHHLATDVSATLRADTSVLDLVAQINPTAAVGGTPRQQALDTIWQLESQAHGMDRGLYAGAVGWLDAAGDGEFGIALRGAVVEDAHHVRVYAGGGIVTGSQPAAELAETHAKMRPIKRALRVLAEPTTGTTQTRA